MKRVNDFIIITTAAITTTANLNSIVISYLGVKINQFVLV